MNLRIPSLLGLLALAACATMPTVYADRPPVLEAGDDRPIPQPEVRVFISELYDADIYVRRELVKTMDPRRVPDAADVNVLDEVPVSSWFHDDQALTTYAPQGPPVAPWTLHLGGESPSGRDDAVTIEDARGVPYELIYDAQGRLGQTTGTMAIASRLVHALGYRTPEVHVVRDGEGRRVAAMQWPIGVDLGPTPIASTREDDPNDRIVHVNRRSLRAIRVMAAWLQIGQIKPRMLRDAYVGEDGKGHVQHFIVGLGGALGVDHFEAAERFARNPDREESNFFFRVFTLGLSPKPPGILPSAPHASSGLFAEHVDPQSYPVGPPFEPHDRVQPPDRYWMAKRVAAVPDQTLKRALDAGELPKEATRWLRERLDRRRADVVAWGFDLTTPCEVVTVWKRPGGRAQVLLRDLAIVSGFLPPVERTYRWRVVDRDGATVVPETTTFALSAITPLWLSAEALKHDYLVMEIRAQRQHIDLPRPLEVHLRVNDGVAEVAAVRH